MLLEDFWSFLGRIPQGSPPFPWERCFNPMIDMLYYKNTIDGSLVVDLRSRVNIGDGLYHTNHWWNFMTGVLRVGNCNNNHHHHRNLSEEAGGDGVPIVIKANCCGPLLYLVVPEKIHFCPICESVVDYQD